MKKAALLFIAAGLVAGMSSCIMEDRTVEFVVTHETCVTFGVDSPTASFVVPATVSLADEINPALSDNDVAREDIVTVRVVSASYGVTAFTAPTPPHDWHITGSISVERDDITDGPATLLDYTSESVQDAYGKHIPAHLNTDGVEIVNRALDDYIAGGNPVLRFKLNNDTVSPVPSSADRIVFEWKPCIVLHIVTKKDINVPDPF
jgi:hypothetical protein